MHLVRNFKSIRRFGEIASGERGDISQTGGREKTPPFTRFLPPAPSVPLSSPPQDDVIFVHTDFRCLNDV